MAIFGEDMQDMVLVTWDYFFIHHDNIWSERKNKWIGEWGGWVGGWVDGWMNELEDEATTEWNIPIWGAFSVNIYSEFLQEQRLQLEEKFV